MSVRVFVVTAALIAATGCQSASQPFVIAPEPEARPAIVVPFDPQTGRGYDLAALSKLPSYSQDPGLKLLHAVEFLNEAVGKMTGAPLEVRNDTDLSRGIVITTLELAPPDVQQDPAVVRALAWRDEHDLAANEAFYIRSEPERLLIVANKVDGLLDGVVELCESVEYEVLGMGSNWVHVPDRRGKPLTFNLERSGRPSFYYRRLWATSGQERGVGTISHRYTLTDPSDEHVETSYRRWQVGMRFRSQSMPSFPGHAMQGFHRKVLTHMRDTGETRGFLAPAIVSPLAERPQPGEALEGTIHIATDNAGTTEPPKVSRCVKGEWVDERIAAIGPSLDMSVPHVRQAILEEMRARALKHFQSDQADELFIFGTDPEDGGGFANFLKHMADPQWYDEYRKQVGDPLGKPYLLHGKYGLDQPTEVWDPTVMANHVYGLADWLLREFSKSEEPLLRDNAHRTRCSFYSYNFHDVPPTFNPDKRLRVMVAGYPKHRGRGRWKKLATSIDVANAISVMLPEPSGDYLILSLSYYQDYSLDLLPPRWVTSPQRVHEMFSERYRAGIRAISVETDFNFGKYGPAYYMAGKMLWNADMTADELSALRDRYLQRAFGSGWEPMRRYHDMLSDLPVNGPNFWAKLLRLIDEADAMIDPVVEPDAQRRIDDVKVYWYYYFLYDTGEVRPDSEVFQRFLWKSQMSYQVATHMVAKRTWNMHSLAEILPESLLAEPAHYTSEETAQWWSQVLAHWPVTPVSDFADATLADGTLASQVDLDDLVLVESFRDMAPTPGLFVYNLGQTTPVLHTVAKEAGDEVGYQLFWVADERAESQLRPSSAKVSYRPVGSHTWKPIDDPSLEEIMPVRLEQSYRNAPLFIVTVRIKAPEAGVYRFEVGRGFFGASLTSLDFDPVTGEGRSTMGATYSHQGRGLTQPPSYIYIPKGTRSLDLEVWDSYNRKTITLFTGLPPARPTPSREVDISRRGTHRIELAPEETGTIAMIKGNGFAMPHFYSVPRYWSMSPAGLLVPRRIAEADGLPIAAP